MKTKIFNQITEPRARLSAALAAMVNSATEKPLIDDVDVSITGFLEAYGQPPHLDFDDDVDEKAFDREFGIEKEDDDEIPAVEPPAPPAKAAAEQEIESSPSEEA